MSASLLNWNIRTLRAAKAHGEALSAESVLSQENEYLMQVLRDNGIDPWALPKGENETE